MTKEHTLLTQKGLGSNIIKCIAMAAMLCDHVSVVFFGDGMTALRWIGRLACPVFCYFVAVGASRTSSVPRYMRRMLIFALLSEVPFDLAFFGEAVHPEYQNVFFTLLAGLFSIWCLQLLTKKKNAPGVLSVFPLAAACVFTELIHSDYGAAGVLCIFCLYLAIHVGNKPACAVCVGVGIFLLTLNLHYLYQYSPAVFLQYPVNRYELGAFAALPLMLLYNGKRGLNVNKYLFYAFYPGHLLLLWGLHLLIG